MPTFCSREVSMHTKVSCGAKHAFVNTLMGTSPKPYINAQKIADATVLSMKI